MKLTGTELDNFIAGLKSGDRYLRNDGLVGFVIGRDSWGNLVVESMPGWARSSITAVGKDKPHDVAGRAPDRTVHLIARPGPLGLVRIDGCEVADTMAWPGQLCRQELFFDLAAARFELGRVIPPA